MRRPISSIATSKCHGSNAKAPPCRGAALPRPGDRSIAFALVLLVIAVNPVAAENRASLLPQLRQGQTLTYKIRLRVDKHIRSQSRIATPPSSGLAPVDTLRTIRIDVVDVAAGNPRAKLVLRAQIQDSAAISSTAKSFEFAIHSDGSVIPPKEIDELSPEDADAWRAWIARFAIAWTVPEKGAKLGDKWFAEENIPGLPLAELSWQKESQYVRDEPCPVAQFPGERCAVVLTTATIKQRSSPKDATPSDYKSRQLKTMGTAKGRNEMFTYISLASGLVVRSSEDATQSMDVLIAKSDGSNEVHYYVEAKSSTQMLFALPSP